MPKLSYPLVILWNGKSPIMHKTLQRNTLYAKKASVNGPFITTNCQIKSSTLFIYLKKLIAVRF